MAAMVEACNSHAFCMALARAATKRKPSSNDNAPAATRAENSPKLCPATISGLNEVPNTLAKITE